MIKHRWQFSLRALLVVTAVVAIIVSVAARMPPVLRLIAGVVCSLYIVIQALEFATSERRPILAAFSWVLFGLLFIAIGLLVGSIFGGALWREEIAFLILMGGCAIICLFHVGRALLAIHHGKLTDRG
jgi:hypothetical protein